MRPQFHLLALSLALCFGAWGQSAKPEHEGVRGARVEVGPNVQVSRAYSNRHHVEVILAADPENPQHLLGCSMVMTEPLSRQVYTTLVYSSMDGGRTWQPTLDDERILPTFSDPSCAFGPGGAAYFVAIAQRSGAAGTLVFRSLDSGKTWSGPSRLPWDDRPFVTVDTTDGKYRGRVYVSVNGALRAADAEGAEAGGVVTYRSTDGGVTFQPPVTLLAKPGWRPMGLGNGVVLSDGTYVAVYIDRSPAAMEMNGDLEQSIHPTRPNASLKVVASVDGGETFSRAVVVTDDLYKCLSDSDTGAPSLAVDRSAVPFHDRVYVVWNDCRLGHGDIMLAYSSDKGRTWSKPTVVNDNGARDNRGIGIHNSMPTVAVNRDGVVAVMWYDRREDPDAFGYWVRFAASLDGGDTFLASVKVSDASTSYDRDRLLLPWARVTDGSEVQSNASQGSFEVILSPDFWPGDTASIAASTDGTFHPFWVDNRTGTMQIWTTRITVEGKAIRNGSEELAAMEDITSRVTMLFTNSFFDRGRKIVRADACLLNTSEQVVIGPVKIRVLSVRSALGAHSVSITNTDNSSNPESGAVWDMTGALHAGKLLPRQCSAIKSLEFQLTDTPRLNVRHTDETWNSSTGDVGFVRLTVRVLGHTER